MPDGAKCFLNSESTDWLIGLCLLLICELHKLFTIQWDIRRLWMNSTWWDGRAVMIVLQMILTPGKTDRRKEKPVSLTNWSVAYPWNTLIEYVTYYVKLPQLLSFQLAWYSSSILYLYVGDVLFESQPGYQLFWGVTWFLEPIQAILDYYLDCIVTGSFQFLCNSLVILPLNFIHL